jgi:hypothetical protein
VGEGDLETELLWTTVRRISIRERSKRAMVRLQSIFLSVSVMEEESSNLLTSAGFNVCNTKLQTAALTTIRKAVSLPSDVAFHRSMDHNFAQDLDAFSERVLLVTNKLLNLAATVDQSQGILGKGKGKLASQDDVVDNFHSLVVDSMDQLLEKTVSFQRLSLLFSLPKYLGFMSRRISREK